MLLIYSRYVIKFFDNICYQVSSVFLFLIWGSRVSVYEVICTCSIEVSVMCVCICTVKCVCVNEVFAYSVPLLMSCSSIGY